MGVALAATLFYLDLDLAKFQDWLRSELNLASSSGWQGTLLAVLIFALSAMLFVPVNLLILAFASIFHGYEAVTYILCGVLGAAAGGYVLGQLLSQKLLHRMLPKKLLTIGEKIKGRHILPLVLVRLTPVAPFSLVNIAAGSVKVHFGIYILGTALGILPGTVSLVFFQNSLFELISEPSAENIALFVGSVIVVLGIFYGLNQRFSQKDQNISEESAHA
ncbi:TVP38/TMEM64 family protein [Pseudobacteriovorax antillogorgiicola]|uniref:TVP38/TMEM64 family membrane protein n=1 Tax=Pseudobacteriovorax antillogorgiicola TaxID=1513793 RepID=A0A1Y6CRK1_9BACT|nr:VTT domain-containing protein [Pseudobacteriovorax antillogorgiicola]TCS45405.1 putative membrane protein YdjX (TVP38/TMEM64 family) [Pseudobacteriovorax antillogorgiicola]SMF73941.1 Uncharacterized membrane protein YdjX, TVP38/TMEM64 family, SNARE-associated domain [Pseudobacteriovorax antillogorgiicola]